MCLSGVWNTVMFLSLRARLTFTKNVVPLFAEYVARWALPQRSVTSAAHLADCFSKSPWQSNVKPHSFKYTASDEISLYRIVTYFVSAISLQSANAVLECTTYLLFARLLELLLSVPHGRVSAGKLCDAVDRFLRACVAARWNDYLHPKCHYLRSV